MRGVRGLVFSRDFVCSACIGGGRFGAVGFPDAQKREP